MSSYDCRELAGIYPLLEVDDMVRFQKPDWKCVFTYVQSFYRRFRNGRSPSPRPGEQSSAAAGGDQAVKLSEVALAVAECQVAEEKGRQMVKQLSKDTGKGEAKPSQQAVIGQSQPIDVESNEQLEKQTESNEEKLCLKIEEATLEEVKEVSKKEEVHTQVASITLKPTNLSPTRNSKMVRSKSLNQEHHGQEEKGNERKFSVNQPMPSESPPALKL